ncbi:hypothetical protein [Haloferax volcanii]|uniref:hypothetical protein n=1 Tax=Haloferax volcanii TaxID=2246 RepID=UPI00249A34E6|nr:hypothetical protein [Haloferax alexandrinus]WEL29861.1 Phage putative head morphogenesis protein, SPP1 gp7 family [Haloferax alexandrinus]
MSSNPRPASDRHPAGCSCHACDHAEELTAATPNSELELEQSGRLDPTETTTIQRDLARFLRGRIADLNADVRALIVDDDVFGLGETDGEWEDLPRGVQLEQFNQWLSEASSQDVLNRLDTETVRAFFERAAASGIRDGHADLREFDVETDDVDDVLAQDAVQEQIEERHSTLQDRVGTSVDDYGRDVSRIVGAGLGANVGRREIAKGITERSRVYQSHVTSQASGEVVNQYTTTQLTSYDRVDAEVELSVDVEYVDAGDDKVCQRCLALSGQTWTLERAQEEDPIPVHGYCRCRFRVTDVQKLF